MNKFQQWARDNYKIGAVIDDLWHPEIIAEINVMFGEFQAKEDLRKAAERARIKEVVSSVADINAELAGRIVVKVSFEGSLPKTKKLTTEEKRLVMNLPDTVKVPIGGDKPLFESKEYDALTKFIQDRRDEFARMGIPHVKFQAAHVVDITRIPEIDELAVKTEGELRLLVENLVAVYPLQITPEATKLGPLYNPRDYKSVESLRGLFKFDYDWMAFGVPDELKQFDSRIYAKAKAKAEKVWAEIEANGVLLLRQTVDDLVGGLVESLTPKDGGEKRKFYATTVTKIQDFIASFKGRNICNDAELDAKVSEMEAIVKGLDLKAMSSDQALRQSVKTRMEGVKSSLSSLVVSASSRMMQLED